MLNQEWSASNAYWVTEAAILRSMLVLSLMQVVCWGRADQEQRASRRYCILQSIFSGCSYAVGL